VHTIVWTTIERYRVRRGYFISRVTNCATINQAKYQLIQMKLIRLSPSLIGWIVPLSAKIRHSGSDKLEHSPRSSCEQVRRNYSIKSTMIVRRWIRILVNEAGLAEAISREEALRSTRCKKVKRKSGYFLCENWRFTTLFFAYLYVYLYVPSW